MTTDLELALEHWQAMAELQVKFIEALAQYKAGGRQGGVGRGRQPPANGRSHA